MPKEPETARTAVVTGGGTGIGRAVARSFALAGDRVMIVGRREDVLSRAAKGIDAEAGGDAAGRLTWLQADVGDPEEVQRLAHEVADRLGHVDVLVNNAGGNAGIDATWEDGTAGIAAAWEANWRLNVLTAVLTTEALGPLLSRPGGRVVLLSSIAAYRGAGSYGAAKAALHAYGFGLAADLGSDGVTVNVVAPGYVTDTEFFGDLMTPERHARLVDETLTGRAGAPHDVADAIRWLASPGASHVTGQILQVNGGACLGR